MGYAELTSNNVVEICGRCLTQPKENYSNNDHYKCECGKLKGRDSDEKVCEKCGKKVKFQDCIVEDNIIYVSGITHDFVFDKDMIEKHKEEIYSMLLQLPKTFLKSSGGGWSFLMACNDVNGNQWTGMHFVMEQLFCMGIAIGKVSILLPKAMWQFLPGGVPYYIVDDTDENPSTSSDNYTTKE